MILDADLVIQAVPGFMGFEIGVRSFAPQKILQAAHF